MNNEVNISLKHFLDLFEEVFDKDWEYSKERMSIQNETEEQKRNSLDMGLEPIDIISDDGTFLNPMVGDETEGWGNRGALLVEYRKLKKLLSD